ncbi:MAG: hypothetical protein ACP5PJ_07415 [Acidimicrobiales bacterium]
MMRSSSMTRVLVVGILTFLATQMVALGNAYASTITTGGGGGTIIVHLGGGGTVSTTSPDGPSGGTSGGQTTIYVPYLVTHAGTSLAHGCVAFQAVTMPIGESATLELAYATSEWNILLAHFPRCVPLQSSPSTNAPTIRPPQIATTIWQDTYIHQLPTPISEIPPGFGVMDVTSYVVTEDPNTMRFIDTTPLGTLTIVATSTYQVDDAGGNPISASASTGAPWPVGGLELQWPSPGSYDMTVVQSWSAQWSLDGETGIFPPLATTSPITNFPVRSLTAIRVLPGTTS